MRVFAVGAYGTNNVGDEAIFDGLSMSFPDCVPIHIGKSRRRNAIFFEQVLHSSDFFQRDDLLIVGGGGLLYDKRAIRLFIELATAVTSRGGRLEVLGLGCEAADESYYSEIRELAAYADVLEVRSSISQDILKRITGREASLREDYAFNLRALTGKAAGSEDDVPHIGLVTSGDYLEDFSVLREIIKKYTILRKAKFHHIPHSRAFFDARNNDLMVGHSLWSSIEIYSRDREDLFFVEPFTDQPLQVLGQYRSLDGVVSQRYHGLVFSKIVEVPHLVMNGNLLKNRSFVADHASQISRVSENSNDLFDAFNDFFELVIELKSARENLNQSVARQWGSLVERDVVLQSLKSYQHFGDQIAEFFADVLVQASISFTEERKCEAVNILRRLPLPPFVELAPALERKVGSKMNIAEILGVLIRNIPFEEEWYLEKYPDVAKAFANGTVVSPHEHFVEFGYYEGRDGARQPKHARKES